MSGDSEKIALTNLSRLERLELEEFLKSWQGGAAWKAEPGEFREARGGAQTLGQPDHWILLFAAGSQLLPGIAGWLARKRRTVTFSLERTNRNGERQIQKIVVKETAPDHGVEAANEIAAKLSDAIKQMSD